MISKVKLILVQYAFYLKKARARSIITNTPIFIITGIGRSGTTLLATLLNQAPGFSVYHEARTDRDALVSAYYHHDKAKAYLRGIRESLVATRIHCTHSIVYGEVNSYLRYHVNAFPPYWQPTILHLVRDGRAVVRSAMNRNVYLASDKNHSGAIRPYPPDSWTEKWEQMDRFERVCWYWAATNRHLLKYDLPIVRLENITTSYDDFAEQVLCPINASIPRDVWQNYVSVVENPSKQDNFPSWNQWTCEQKKQFTSLCGDVMHTLGYDFANRLVP